MSEYEVSFGKVPMHRTADVDDHVWVVAGLAQYVDVGEDHVWMGVTRNAVVLACPCGRSRWVKTHPEVVEEPPEMDRAVGEG